MEHERERTARAEGFGTWCCVRVPVESLNPEPAHRPTNFLAREKQYRLAFAESWN